MSLSDVPQNKAFFAAVFDRFRRPHRLRDGAPRRDPFSTSAGTVSWSSCKAFLSPRAWRSVQP